MLIMPLHLGGSLLSPWYLPFCVTLHFLQSGAEVPKQPGLDPQSHDNELHTRLKHTEIILQVVPSPLFLSFPWDHSHCIITQLLSNIQKSVQVIFFWILVMNFSPKVRSLCIFKPSCIVGVARVEQVSQQLLHLLSLRLNPKAFSSSSDD